MANNAHRLSLSEKRKVENQVVFRKANEEAQKSLKGLRKEAKLNHDNSALFMDDEIRLHFYCECADENCKERIVMTPKEYEQIHSDKTIFIVLPGHQVAGIEEVVKKKPKYNVVEKYTVPGFKNPSLNTTDVQNA